MVIHDWSQLPADLLGHIAKQLVFISDFIRFRSVCTTWRAAAVPNNLRPQPPQLLLPYNDSSPDRYIFSLATRRVHHLVLPQLAGKRILSTANGWMLIVDIETEALSLLNPVTTAQVLLPPNYYFDKPVTYGYLFHDLSADSFMVITAYFDDSNGYFDNSNVYFDDSNGYFDDSKEMGFIKVGDESWGVLAGLERLYVFIGYHGGKIFGHNLHNIYTHDASLAYSNQPVFACSLRDIPGISDSLTLFDTANGQVFLLSDHSPFVDPGKIFLVYKLDCDGLQVTWSKVQFEDYAIFDSRRQGYIMCCVKDFPRYKENCVYAIRRTSIEGYFDNRAVVRIFDKEDGTSSFVSCDWEQRDDLGHPPQWITLSLL